MSLNVERINGGMPIISPSERAWETWLTCNPAATFLERTPHNDEIIKGLLGIERLDDPRLAKGVAVIHYRAMPKEYEGFPPSYVGIAVFTPDYQLLKRFENYVFEPCKEPDGLDYTSAEDPRISRIGDTFYMLYCGYTIFPDGRGIMSPCYATSKDLIHWEKQGAFKGEVTEPNKDHLLFDETIDGYYFMLHRPCAGQQSDFKMQIAMAKAIDGEWKNLGVLFGAPQKAGLRAAWNGGSTVPIALGNKRYLVIYHTGEWYPNGDRNYFIDAAIFNFNHFDPAHPEKIVEHRLEHILAPEGVYESHAPDDPEHNLACLFPCGSYLYNNDVYIIYGGANHYCLAAKVNLSELVSAIESAPVIIS